ncbi:MAG: hypothetical protein IJH37_09860 [Clostridia bacterium]|nr:hypothetical protein [Clostridia bacterium]
MNDIQNLKSQYSNCNLLMPLATETQLNPYYKYTVTTVNVDLSENTGDIFKVGTIKVNGQWVELFSPAKPLLMKLAAAAGIQFDPNHTYGTYISKNIYKAKAYGAMRMADGTGKTHCDEKVISLDDEEDKYRMEFMDKAVQGIVDQKAATETAKMFPGGEWIDTVDKFNKPVKAYKVQEKDRQAYIDRSVMVNMMLLRKTFAEKAMTGAILRVVRALIGLKGTYTKQELQKPFAIPRVTFSPDYNNPEVRQTMLSMGMNSMGNMFGTSSVPAALPETPAKDVVNMDFDPEEFAGNPAFISDKVDDPMDGLEELDSGYQEEYEGPFPDETASSPSAAADAGNASGDFCANCGRAVSAKVASYSGNKFGRVLCMSCQKGA